MKKDIKLPCRFFTQYKLFVGQSLTWKHFINKKLFTDSWFASVWLKLNHSIKILLSVSSTEFKVSELLWLKERVLSSAYNYRS